MDYRHERFDPPEGEVDRGLWQVHFPLDASDKAAFQRAAPVVVPAERMQFHTDVTEGTDGDTTFAIRVHASRRDEALDEAQHLVRKIRSEAGLPSAAPEPTGYISPWWQSNSIGAHIGAEAHELHRQRRHELAVVRIQTACELHIAEAVGRLLAEHPSRLEASKLIRRPMTLRDERSRAVMHLLTGRRIEQEPWWPEYRQHLDRRNAVVHDGVAVTYEDSVRSIEVSLQLRRWLLEIQGVDLSDLDADLDSAS
ncbi:MAG: hypothetical protein JSS99_12025 [Actinobacteria bacterium]|nr:hypothetical protein [Actinomycetota bacterium]